MFLPDHINENMTTTSQYGAIDSSHIYTVVFWGEVPLLFRFSDMILLFSCTKRLKATHVFPRLHLQPTSLSLTFSQYPKCLLNIFICMNGKHFNKMWSSLSCLLYIFFLFIYLFLLFFCSPFSKPASPLWIPFSQIHYHSTNCLRWDFASFFTLK